VDDRAAPTNGVAIVFRGVAPWSRAPECKRVRLPELDGRWITDEDSVRRRVETFGRHAPTRASSVFEPTSARGIVDLILHARQAGLPVCARGQAHSTFHQTDAAGGVLVDMRSLAGVRQVAPGSVWVDAGATWRQVLDKTLPTGQAPPTLTDYQHLTVGGTLSVGGVGGETFRSGAQVDNVLELEVVTGAGELLVCSRSHHKGLFDACLAGLGRCGIITRARLVLTAAPDFVETTAIECPTLGALFALLGRVAKDGSFDHLYANIDAPEGKDWRFELVASRYLTVPTGVTRARDVPVHLHTTRSWPFSSFVSRVDEYVNRMRECGTWQMAHPWLDLFVPEQHAMCFIEDELKRLSPSRLGGGGILIYPLRRGTCRAPLMALPEGDGCYLFDVLRNCPVDDAAQLASQVEENRRAFERCVALGGSLYPIGSMPMSEEDWQGHFGRMPDYPELRHRFDPDELLAPGMKRAGAL
jgi:cytokinin dehydrogenase